jgi:excisionase family DNA binding protein
VGVADGNGSIPPGRRSLWGESFTGVTRCAKQLGLSERTIRAAIRDGSLPIYRFGMQARLKVSDVRLWIERHRIER